MMGWEVIAYNQMVMRLRASKEDHISDIGKELHTWVRHQAPGILMSYFTNPEIIKEVYNTVKDPSKPFV